MFMDLEKILPAGVRVVSIQPKHDKGIVEVKLTIGALNDEAKMKFLHALEQSPSFSAVADGERKTSCRRRQERTTRSMLN